MPIRTILIIMGASAICAAVYQYMRDRDQDRIIRYNLLVSMKRTFEAYKTTAISDAEIESIDDIIKNVDIVLRKIEAKEDFMAESAIIVQKLIEAEKLI